MWRVMCDTAYHLGLQQTSGLRVAGAIPGAWMWRVYVRVRARAHVCVHARVIVRGFRVGVPTCRSPRMTLCADYVLGKGPNGPEMIFPKRYGCLLGGWWTLLEMSHPQYCFHVACSVGFGCYLRL